MGKIRLIDVSFTYDGCDSPIFEHTNIAIDTAWRLGLVGRNGRGKTTLLKLLHGNFLPNNGKIISNVTTELYPYILDNKYPVVLDYVKENIGNIASMEKELERLETDHCANDASYISLLDQYREAGGYSAKSRIEKEFFEMGLSHDLLHHHFDELSGGEQTKVQIAILFIRNPGFVLLDEPTNHLDKAGSLALSNYLRRKTGFIIVSHDREFLDQTIDHVISINKSNIQIEKGNFSTFKKNKDDYENYESRTKENLGRQIRQFELTAEKNRRWSDNSNMKRYEFRTNARERSSGIMKRAIHSEKVISKNIEQSQELLKNFEMIPKLVLSQRQPETNVLVEGAGLCFAYSQQMLFHDISFQVRSKDRLCISGKNGAGKSTLLNIICGRLPVQRGVLYVNDGVSIAYSMQYPLYTHGCIHNLFGSEQGFEKMRGIAKLFGISEKSFMRPLETLSPGEQKKIDIARVLACDYSVLVLDEPLNYTDIYFRKQLEEAILTYEPTLIFVEHDAAFCNHTATKYIHLSHD